MKKKYKILIQFFCSACFLTGLYFFCEKQTQGFRFHQLLSNVPNDARWDISPLTFDEKAQLPVLLDQTFTFIGKGGFCWAFLGEDKKTVLKFYTHHFLDLFSLFTHFSWEKLLLKSPSHVSALSPYLEFAFKSCKLLYTHAKENTGLIYIHLNKTKDLFPSVTLIDPIGMRHTIDLDKTEFVLQQRAEPLIAYIARSIEEKHSDHAQKAIDQYLNCLLTLSRLGIKDLDRSFRDNYGILGNGMVVSMDISSFTEDACIQRPGYYKKEIILKSHNLAKWLKKHHPELFVYYEKKLVDFIENQ
jgi:hypothetical protein